MHLSAPVRAIFCGLGKGLPIRSNSVTIDGKGRWQPVTDRFAVFDVETPNSYNNRMSAIGVTIVENGKIIEEFGTLINPETYFDRFNIQLTKITPEAVADQPNFSALWPKLEALFADSVLIAHNAPFDMGVLGKCLRDYGIFWKKRTLYACTCRMGRVCYPCFCNHKLDTMCRMLQIDLEHHKASSDSRACAELLIDYLNHGLDVQPFIRAFDFETFKTIAP